MVQKQLASILATVLIACAVQAQQIPLTVKGDTVTVVRSVPYTVEGPQGYDLYFWSVPNGVEYIDNGSMIQVTKSPEGSLTFRLRGVSIDWTAKKLVQKHGNLTVVVGKLPAPGPGPTPPGPDPKPDPDVPISEKGLRVLIIYESGDLSKLNKNQLDILYNKSFRDFLNQNCVVGPDGKTKEWRIWDKDISTKYASETWQKVMQRQRKSVPWLIVSNGTSGVEMALPATVAETRKVIERFIK